MSSSRRLPVFSCSLSHICTRWRFLSAAVTSSGVLMLYYLVTAAGVCPPRSDAPSRWGVALPTVRDNEVGRQKPLPLFIEPTLITMGALYAIHERNSYYCTSCTSDYCMYEGCCELWSSGSPSSRHKAPEKPNIEAWRSMCVTYWFPLHGVQASITRDSLEKTMREL